MTLEITNPQRLTRALFGGAVALILIVIASCGVTTVEPGHKGVKVRFGEVLHPALPEGLYFVNPLSTHIEEMDTRVLKWASKTGTYTRDVQQAQVGFTLTYRLHPERAAEMYGTVGRDWASKLVGQVIVEDIKREIGQHNAVDLIAQRDTAARAIEQHVKDTLAKRDVLVTNFQLTDIEFTAGFEHAVEEKVKAQQEAIREQNRTVQIEEQAKQKIATARGQAEATVLNAKAEAESILIRARALEQNANLVQWEAVKQWDGKLPIYLLGETVPFVQVPTR